MLTWRYHLLTLVAIFLALGLGVLVGISLSDSGVVETGNATLVDDIRRDVQDLSKRNDELGKERSINQRYQDDTFPFLVEGHLQGKSIAVVAASVVGDDVIRELGSAVNGAGGQIVSTTRLNSRFDTAATAEKIKSAFPSDTVLANVNETTVTTVLGQQIAADIGAGGGSELLSALQGTLVDATSGDYKAPVNAVVLINRADNEQSPAYAEWEKQFILSMHGLGIATFGSEPTDAPISEVPMFISVSASSVDNLDSRIGQLSMIYLLGGERGTFGVKPTADLLIPILRDPKPGNG